MSNERREESPPSIPGLLSEVKLRASLPDLGEASAGPVVTLFDDFPPYARRGEQLVMFDPDLMTDDEKLPKQGPSLLVLVQWEGKPHFFKYEGRVRQDGQALYQLRQDKDTLLSLPVEDVTIVAFVKKLVAE